MPAYKGEAKENEMIKSRTRNEATQQEVQIFDKFCLDNGIVTEGPAGEAQVLALAEYLMDEWKVEVTPESLDAALEQFKKAGRIQFYPPAPAKYKRIAMEDLPRANALRDWVSSNANRSLVKGGGDDDLDNQTALLAELRGRDINSSMIQDAIGRCAT